MSSIKERCTQGPLAAKHGAFRTAASIGLAVIHSAEAADDYGSDTSAEGVANYFAGPLAKASTQLAVDRDSCVRMLSDSVVPWGAPGANSRGVHVEICGRATWTKAEWMKPSRDPMLRRSAYKVAVWCFHYRIPTRWVGPTGLRRGDDGLTTHADVTKAWPDKGTHWDPGPNFPKVLFLGYVRAYLAEIKKEAARGN